MDLKLKDVADMLKVSEKTVYRWVNDNLIPYYRINRQYRFNREELKAWLLTSRIGQGETASDALLAEEDKVDKVDMVSCIGRGGIFYRVSGDDVETVIRNAVAIMPIPAELEPETVIHQLLQREAIISTGMGDGIAIPHPHVPLLSNVRHESISICFLERPVDFRALDREPVFVLFVVLSANARRHLEMLAKISYLCHQAAFRELLRCRALRRELVDFIAVEQKKWLA
ncbi:MAG: PTS sugar transporter subunit IIA [Victivallales bacterium]|nr:PTS sugar transporter subunit IIA [Victivallales bacterium]